MALTARATEPPTWENQIVPTLRKRLEDESRALSKRMSNPPPPDDVRRGMVRSTSDQDRPSHIPRPSMQSLLSDDTHRTRPRTHSTPRPFDSDILTPASSRSASPAIQARPSRIPTRPRAGSRALGTDTAFPPSPDPSPDLWPVAEDSLIRAQLTPPTPDRPDHPRRKRDTFVPPPPSDADEILFDEPAPFAMANGTEPAPRPSLDEYEHWYRGEGRGGGGRNGGRGEIRIATRTEMLEIASFGHPPSRGNSNHGHGMSDFGWRQKAYDDSTVGTRTMWVDEHAERVLDEAPLTDLDDVDTDSMYHHSSQEFTVDSHPRRSEMQHEDALSEPEPEPEPDPEPAPVTPARPRPSRIARATSPPVGPGASTTSLVSGRSTHSPTPSKSKSKPKSNTRSPPPRATPKTKSPSRRGTTTNTPSKSPSRAGTSQLSPPSGTPKSPKTPKIRATSPGKSATSSPQTRSQSTPKRTKKLSTGGIGPGPHPLADAIPQIPQDQQPDDGNWDDVVLPTVARRMQGSDVILMERKPVVEKEELIPPAPGTFGYPERQRQREPKTRQGEGTELEEFGAWDGMAKKKVEKPEERKAPSPPPFSDYTPIPPPAEIPPPQSIRTTPPAAQPNGMVITEAQLREPFPDKDKDSHGAGCCKCVVM